MYFKKLVVLLFVGFFFCGQVFANDIMNSYFNGDDLNRKINSYVSNVSSLIPDTSTLQDVWAYAPGSYGFSKGWFGGGFNGSICFLDRTKVGSLAGGVESFGAGNLDLTQFPEGVPFLPGISFDLKGGFNLGKFKTMDFGVSGMWVDDTILADNDIVFFGEGSSFSLKALGFNIRYSVLQEKLLLPSVTVQAGYYFTMYNFGITATTGGNNENVSVDFRSDSFLFGVQASKNLIATLLTPYAGLKLLISKTDSEFEWHTKRAVMLRDEPYLNGVSYYSASSDGDVQVYGQFYAGLGVSIPTDNAASRYIFTLGGAYTMGTNHFSLNAAVRMLIGG